MAVHELLSFLGFHFLASCGPFWHTKANQMDPEMHPTAMQILFDVRMAFSPFLNDLLVPLADFWSQSFILLLNPLHFQLTSNRSFCCYRHLSDRKTL